MPAGSADSQVGIELHGGQERFGQSASLRDDSASMSAPALAEHVGNSHAWTFSTCTEGASI